MTEDSPLAVSLRDPLSQVTRLERRMLLGISVLSIFITETGLIPSKISALGVEFGETDQQAFLVVMSLVVLYFVVAFFVYGSTDILAWRLSYNQGARAKYRETFERIHNPSLADEQRAEDYYPADWIPLWPNRLAMPASLLRAAFEFLLPLAVGLYAIFSLVSVARHGGA